MKRVILLILSVALSVLILFEAIGAIWLNIFKGKKWGKKKNGRKV